MRRCSASSSAQDLIAETCARLTRNLTAEEWKQYLSDTSYRKVVAQTVEDLEQSAEEVPERDLGDHRCQRRGG